MTNAVRKRNSVSVLMWVPFCLGVVFLLALNASSSQERKEREGPKQAALLKSDVVQLDDDGKADPEAGSVLLDVWQEIEKAASIAVQSQFSRDPVSTQNLSPDVHETDALQSPENSDSGSYWERNT